MVDLELTSAVAAIGHILKSFANMMDVPCDWVPYLLLTRGTLTAMGRIIRFRGRLCSLAKQSSQAIEEDGEGEGGIGEHELLAMALAVLATACFANSAFAAPLAMLCEFFFADRSICPR